jgi:hypothetical protein
MTCTAISLILLLLSAFDPQPSAECKLTETFETDFLTARYSSNWKAYHYGGGHSLMYYEEANFDRREDAEITFSKTAIPGNVNIDTMTIASLFLNERLHRIRNDPKFQQVNGSIKLSDESIEAINGITWHKVVVDMSGMEENKRLDLTNTFYFRYTSLVVFAVTFRTGLPEIPTVEKEFPCILRSIKFK